MMNDYLNSQVFSGRGVVAGRLLQQEALMVDVRFRQEVEKATAVTLSLDGWSSCRMQLLYGFVAILPGRETTSLQSRLASIKLLQSMHFSFMKQVQII